MALSGYLVVLGSGIMLCTCIEFFTHELCKLSVFAQHSVSLTLKQFHTNEGHIFITVFITAFVHLSLPPKRSHYPSNPETVYRPPIGHVTLCH